MVDVRTIAVLGAGDMGHGVAELAALKGFRVTLRDVDAAALERASRAIRRSLDKLVEKQRLTAADADAAFARIVPTTDLGQAVGEADLVLEAVPEKLDLKQRVFAEVEAAAPARAVFASNTSAIRIQEIGEKLRDPSRLVGMHFFNPVMLMDLVEVIPAPASSPGAVRAVEDVARRIGKTVVTLDKDTPGFVTSRLIGIWVGAGVLAHEAKLADKEAIDAALRYQAGFPMGPFELADYTGLDIGVHAAEYIASRLGEAYRPGASLRAMVEKGALGKKTGLGFYAWKDGRMTTKLTSEMGRDVDPALVLALVVNEAARLLDEGVADAARIDLAMRNGCAFPKGPFEWADEVGLDRVVKALYTLEERTGSPLASPHETLLRRVEEGKLGKKTGGGFHAAQVVVSNDPQGAAASGTAPAYETLLVEVDEATHVGTITLNRPHRLHAINGALIRDLRTALQRMEEDARVRVVLLTATGEKAFCVGADLSDSSEATPARMQQLAREGHLMCVQMEKMGKPVVAALNGYAFGGGLELALPADFRVAARRVLVALPEVTLGLLPAMGGTQRLPKLIGLARAKQVALLGDRIDAQQAFEWGLVHVVFENATFEKEAKAFAARLATRAPLALRSTKQLLNAAPTTDILAGMEAEAAAFGVLATTEDMMEGVSSMFQKKAPEFQGK